MTNSLIEAAAKMGMTIAVGCPPGYQPNRKIVDLSLRLSAAYRGSD